MVQFTNWDFRDRTEGWRELIMGRKQKPWVPHASDYDIAVKNFLSWKENATKIIVDKWQFPRETPKVYV